MLPRLSSNSYRLYTMMLCAVLETLSHLRTWSTLTSLIRGPLFRMGVMLSTRLNRGLGMTPTAEFSSMVPGTQIASMQGKSTRLYISLPVL